MNERLSFCFIQRLVADLGRKEGRSAVLDFFLKIKQNMEKESTIKRLSREYEYLTSIAWVGETGIRCWTGVGLK